jgi:hypothetical protein
LHIDIGKPFSETITFLSFCRQALFNLVKLCAELPELVIVGASVFKSLSDMLFICQLNL